MIDYLSSWTKSIVFAVIIVSILEMILPNNKHQKYVKMVMGIFILYNIISPIIKNQNSLSFDEINVNSLANNSNGTIKNESNSIVVNQESMDRRLEELYIQQIEKDITKKVEKQGYIVKSCKVKATITEDEEKTGITKIKLKVEKDENKAEDNNKEDEIEDRIVAEIQKIKKVTTKITTVNTGDDPNLERQDIQNLKQFLIKEYGVSEKCLEIN